ASPRRAAARPACPYTDQRDRSATRDRHSAVHRHPAFRTAAMRADADSDLRSDRSFQARRETAPGSHPGCARPWSAGASSRRWRRSGASSDAAARPFWCRALPSSKARCLPASSCTRPVYSRTLLHAVEIPPLSDTSPLYWMIGKALQKLPKCSLCLERGRLGIPIFSSFKNVLSSLKICGAFAFFHCKQKSLSVRKFLKLLKRLLVH